jgi:hypothetical protein
MTSRHEFTQRVKDALFKRVGGLCSDPECRNPTTGPATDPNKSTNVGAAAHVTAAAPGGPRYDPSLSEEERRSSENGIWLCQNCATLVDKDEARYPVDLLREWKLSAELDALVAIKGAKKKRGTELEEISEGVVDELKNLCLKMAYMSDEDVRPNHHVGESLRGHEQPVFSTQSEKPLMNSR